MLKKFVMYKFCNIKIKCYFQSKNPKVAHFLFFRSYCHVLLTAHFFLSVRPNKNEEDCFFVFFKRVVRLRIKLP